MTFTETGLDETILKALSDSGYTTPTPVQAQTIPAVMAGRDLMVSSQTGSGKTAAFMLPVLHRLAAQERRPFVPRPPRPAKQKRQSASIKGKAHSSLPPARPRVLVLAPTRELALQVTAATDKYGHYIRHLKAVAILGGMPYPKQMELLSRNPEILVATPGRLIDHMTSGKIDFSELQLLVLDEADRMLDMGFIEDIERIVAATPPSRQTLLFSATLDGPVAQIARKITRDAERIRIESVLKKQENIAQRLYFVDDIAHKNRLLDHMLRDASIDQAVIFTATKREADTLSDCLNLAGMNVAALHGDMHQGMRNRTLNAMRRGQLRILVATDVAARGIDVPTITHVFNYDLPRFAEDYVHRIGRTGRAGRAGTAISLVTASEQIHVRRIERFTKQTIPVDIVIGHEPKRHPLTKQSRPEKEVGQRPKKSGWKKKTSGNKEGTPGTRSARFPNRGEKVSSSWTSPQRSQKTRRPSPAHRQDA